MRISREEVLQFLKLFLVPVFVIAFFAYIITNPLLYNQYAMSTTAQISFSENDNMSSSSSSSPEGFPKSDNYENSTKIKNSGSFAFNSSSTDVSSSFPPLRLPATIPCIKYDNETRTINICGGDVNLQTIDSTLKNPSILNQTSKKRWFLNANISIANDATLRIDSADTDWLKINSTSGTAYSITAQGNLLIDRTRITSWNTTSNTETILNTKTQPRSYLMAHSNGTGYMNITNSNLSHLGSNTSKQTWGISYYSANGSIIKNNTFSFNYRSIYLSGEASDIGIVDNVVYNSSQYGLDIYGAKNINLINNTVYNSHSDGIYCSSLCRNVRVENNTVFDNGRDGIVLGEDSANIILKNNLLYDNERSGIGIRNSFNNIVSSNLVKGNQYGITISAISYNNSINKNTIENSSAHGLYLHANCKDNKFEKNIVTNSSGSGIYAKDTRNNTFIKNTITASSNAGMNFFNASHNILKDNNIYNNNRYNYYSRSNSTNNMITDTTFDNMPLRFLDKSSNFIIQNTDNRIINNNKKIPISAYATNTSLSIVPINKTVIVDSLDMFVIPSADHVNISSIDKGFDFNQRYKKWLEVSAIPAITTRYVIGNFEPNTQIAIKVNGSFWNAYTSNSSGDISFTYDDGGASFVRRFEAQVNNLAALSTIILFAAIISAISIFVSIRWMRGKRSRARITAATNDADATTQYN